MLADLITTLSREFSGVAAKDYVAHIIRHHRIRNSPGFRDAAQYVLGALAQAGVAAEIISLPMQDGLRYWGQTGFQGWEAVAATLDLVQPAEAQTRLCDYRESKFALIQRSGPTAPVEAEVVVLDDGTELSEYAGLDLAGKLVLTRGEVGRVRELAVERYGALGLLFDGMKDWLPVRQPLDLPDARQYTQFSWRGSEKRCFGFVLSPRQGAALRQLVQTRAREGQASVKVRAAVQSRFQDGATEIVSARIPGETDEEILVVAHLCHPEPSANDNASGCGAALEAARALQALIDAGKLARPRRTIHFLWLSEISGTYAYLATHPERLPRMIAGLNLDMVGEDQDQCGSVWLVEYPPEAMSSFAGDLMARVQEELAGDLKNLAGNESYAFFRYGVSRFSGGSDHIVLSDPSVGIPTPMLIQWPDRFYHTSEDTLDKVSPAMLAKVGIGTSAYAYFLAQAGAPQAQWLAQEMLTRYRGVAARRVQDVITAAMSAAQGEELAQSVAELAKKAAYWADREREALSTLRRLDPAADGWLGKAQTVAAQALQAEVTRAEDAIAERARALGLDKLPAVPASPPDAWEEQAARIVPTRKFPGPIPVAEYLHRLPFERREEIRAWQERHKVGREMSLLALYWADGKRNLLEIAHLVAMESGRRDTEFLVGYFRLLRELDLLSF